MLQTASVRHLLELLPRTDGELPLTHWSRIVKERAWPHLEGTLWALCLLQLANPEPTRPVVLVETGSVAHVVLVGLFLVSGAPLRWLVGTGKVTEHARLLLQVGVTLLAWGLHIDGVFGRDGGTLLFGLYLLVLVAKLTPRIEHVLLFGSILVGAEGLELGLSIAEKASRPSPRLPDYGDLVGEMGPGGFLRSDFNGLVVGSPGPVRFETERHGFRTSRTVTRSPLPGRRRLMLVGDSFAVGYRVGQNDFIGARLQRELDSPTVPTEVIVAGASHPPDYARYIRRYAHRFHPDLVLVGLTLGNDVASSLASELGVPLETGFLAQQMLPRDAYRHRGLSVWMLRTHRSLLDWRWYERIEATLRPEGIASWLGDEPFAVHLFDGIHGLGLFYNRPLPLLTEAFEALESSLERVFEACDQRDLACALLLFPQRFQVDAAEWDAVVFDYALAADRFDLLQPNAQVLRFCANAKVECLDTLPAFRAASGRDLYLPAGDMHWSAEGHALAAEAVAKWLDRTGWKGF